MAGRRAPSRRPTVLAQTPKVDDQKTQRALDVVHQAVLDLQSRRHLEQFTSTEPGYVPESGGSAVEFLCADGTWKVVSGSGVVDSVTAGSSMVSVAPTTGNVVVDVVPANFTGIPMSGITFSGTNNRVVKYSGTTLADSTITDTGVLVTIASPINVTGTADFDSSVLVNSTLTVNGAVDFDSTLDVDGAVNFDSTLTLSTMTQGSVLFIGASGLVTQDNPKLFFDDSNNRLGVGTNTPTVGLEVFGSDANTDVVRIKNTAVTGFSAIAFWDSTGVLRGATGWGNASVPDTNVIGKLYWRTLGSDMVYATGTPAVSTTAMMLFDATGNVNIGTGTSDPSVKLRVQGAFSYTGNGTLGDAVSDTHAITGNTTITGNTSGMGLEVKTSAQANIRIRGDSDNSGSDSSYTGLVIARGTTPTELWFIGRDGTGSTDGLIFRRSASTDDFKIDASGNFTIGAATTASHTVNGRAALTNTTATASAFSSTQNPTGGTTSDLSAGVFANSGTYSTSATARSEYGVRVVSSSTRSTGANDLTNVAGYFTASGAQVNVALRTDAGNVLLNQTGGTFSCAGAATFTSTLNGQGAADFDSTLNVDGNVTLNASVALGNAVTDTHTFNGNITHTANGNGYAYAATITPSALAANSIAFSLLVNGTIDCSGGSQVAIGVLGQVTTTRSAGANSLINYGGYFSASGGQANYALFTEAGDNLFNSSSGSSTFNGACTVVGAFATNASTTLGGAGTDAHTVNGTLGVSGTAKFAASVAVGSNTAPAGYLDATDGTVHALVHVASSEGVYGTSSNHAIGLWTNGTKRVSISAAGAFTTLGDTTICDGSGDTLKFYGGTGATQQTVTGSRGGNAALADLLTKLATLGLIVDSTS